MKETTLGIFQQQEANGEKMSVMNHFFCMEGYIRLKGVVTGEKQNTIIKSHIFFNSEVLQPDTFQRYF